MRRAAWLLCLAALLASGAAAQTVYNNLDDTLTGWQNPPCSNLNPPGGFCAGGNGTPTAPPTQTINNSTPSLDGESMLTSFSCQSGLPSGETTNVLWPYKTPSFDNNATYFSGIYNYYYPSVSNLQAQESDQFKFDSANNRYMMGLECDSPSLATGKVRTWNQATSSWVTQGTNCGIITANTWHRLQVVSHTDPPSSTACGGAPCYHYDAVSQDGVVSGPYAAEPSAVVSETPANGIQTQLDCSSAGGTSSSYVDEMSLTTYDSIPVGSCSSFAAGSCPASIPSGVTKFYFVDYVSGSDANDGTQETTSGASGPWQHAPGMANATGVPASHTPTAGEGWIFRGGVTVDYHAFPANVPWGGTSGAPDYMGPDPGWFSGGSWTQPIFSGGGSAGYNSVSQTLLTDRTNSASFVTIDNIEFTGLYFSGTPSNSNPATAGYIAKWAPGYVSSSTNWTVENSYLHDGTHTSYPTSFDPGNESSWIQILSGTTTSAPDTTSSIHNNAIDDTDGGDDWGDALGSCNSYQNYIAGFPNVVFGGCGTFHDNWITQMAITFVPQADSPPHGNAIHSFGSLNTNKYYYNNRIDCLNTQTYDECFLVEETGSMTVFAFNNVIDTDFHGSGFEIKNNNTNYMFQNTQECGPDPTPNNTCFQLSGAGTITGYNNVGFTSNSNNNTVTESGYTGTASFSPVVSKTCSGGAQNIYGGVQLCAPIGTGNGVGNLNLTQTYPFAPLDSTAAGLIGTGSNIASIVATLSGVNSTAATAAGFDTTLGVSYNTSNHTVSFPARTPITRPSTPENGAYQPSVVTYTLTLNNSTGGVVTSSPSGIACATATTCTASFASGTVVTLSESPNTGYGFAQWLGACTGNSSCSVTMSANQTVSAGFFYTYPGVVNNNTGIITGNSLPTGLPGTGTGIAIPFAPALGNFVINSTAFGSINATSNCITNLWDFNSSAAASTGNITNSGGVADIMASLHTNYIAIGAPGGVDRPISVNTSGNCAQINNTNEPYSTTASGVYPNTNFNILGGFAFSRVTDNKFVWLDEHPCVASCAGITNTSTSAFTILYSGSITCTGAACLNPIPYTGSFVADFRLCPGIGSVGAGISSSTLVETDGDEYYAVAISFTGIQGTGIYVFVFSPTLGCETLNTATGNIYTWCAPSTSCATASPIGQETTCYGAVSPNGIHDIQGRGDSYLAISQAGSGWTNCSSLGQHSVLWRFTDTAVCNTSPCPGGFGTTVQNVSVTAGGHDAVGDLNLIKENDPNPNYRPLSNTSTFTQFASITAGTHTTIAADPSGQDLGAVMEFIQGATGVGNTGWGWDNPQALAFENELTAFPGWQDFIYTGTNLPISRFVSNYDAANIEVLASSGTPITVSATSTIATYAIAHPFPACLSGGSTCGALQVAVTNCTNTQFNQTANLATVNYSGANPVSFTINGTYTPQSATADTTCKVIGNSPNFGSANGIGYISQDQSWAVMGYNGFCQLGADSSNQCFSGAIMVRLNVLGAVSPFFKWGANPNSGIFEIKWR